MNRYSEQELIAFGAKLPKIKLNPLPKYCMANQDYGMTIDVLDNGEWLLPISAWVRYHISKTMPQGIRRDLDDMLKRFYTPINIFF
jgi:hypothetical protein